MKRLSTTTFSATSAGGLSVLVNSFVNGFVYDEIADIQFSISRSGANVTYSAIVMWYYYL
jgi:hypothetical protein